MITHLACIMDGNRRWARAHNKMAWEGHMQGMKSLELVIQFCQKKNIKYLSLYVFSIENFNRAQEEKDFLFYELFLRKAGQFADECKKYNVQVRFIGDRALIPDFLRSTCADLERDTAVYDGLVVNLLFCYGGQQEIVAATKTIAQKVIAGLLGVEEITLDAYKKALWSYPTPPPDLIIRTGGMQRLSNFLLFSAAYAELMFLPQMWPEITEEILEDALNQFLQRERKFGA
jgi:undecaprenyl diphosphate synthase